MDDLRHALAQEVLQGELEGRLVRIIRPHERGDLSNAHEPAFQLVRLASDQDGRVDDREDVPGKGADLRLGKELLNLHANRVRRILADIEPRAAQLLSKG